MRRFILWGGLACLAATLALPAASLQPDPERPDPHACLIEATAHDGDGNPVLTTPAFVLNRPGLVAMPLSRLQQGGVRWSDLHFTTASPAGESPIAANRATRVDPAHNLLVVHAPGLAPCGYGVGPRPPDGSTLVGTRPRIGYRPRVFAARLQRSVTLPGGATVLQVEIPDGGGAASGLLLDRDGHLVATILPPSPAGADHLVAAVALGDLDPTLDGPGSGIGIGEIQNFELRFSADTPTALMGRALTAVRGGGTGDAIIEVLDRIEQVTGPFAALYLERGAVYFEAGRIERAAVEFQTAIAAAPQTHLAHYNLGITLGAGGLYDEAATVFRRALEIAPEHPRTHYQLALALTAAHRLPEAREEHRLLSHLDPSLAADLQGLIGF